MPILSPTQTKFCPATALLQSLAVLLLAGWSLSVDAVAQQAAHDAAHAKFGDGEFKKKIRPFIENYCTDCHSEDGEGGVDLDRFETKGDVVADLELWSRAVSYTHLTLPTIYSV